MQSAKRLDTGMLKSRARLGKQGALAQRRKPTKQDPSKRQTWMFGDPNGMLGLFVILFMLLRSSSDGYNMKCTQKVQYENSLRDVLSLICSCACWYVIEYNIMT